MRESETRLAGRSMPAPFPLLYYVARVLALVDAVAVPCVLLFWVWRWPGHHGGFVGATVGTLLVWWMLGRGARAAFDFEGYRWMARHVAKVVAVGLILRGVLLVQRIL